MEKFVNKLTNVEKIIQKSHTLGEKNEQGIKKGRKKKELKR